MVLNWAVYSPGRPLLQKKKKKKPMADRESEEEQKGITAMSFLTSQIQYNVIKRSGNTTQCWNKIQTYIYIYIFFKSNQISQS